MINFVRKYLFSFFVASSTLFYSLNGLSVDNGTITVFGYLYHPSCTVSNPYQEVSFGQVGNRELMGVEKISEKVPFQIHLESCSPGELVTLKFNGSAANGYNDLLNVSGGATGLGVGIWEQGSDDRVLIGENLAPKLIESSSMTFDLEAAYVGTSAEVTPGQANASATFDIIYP